MESKIKKKYLQDCLVVLAFTAMLWILQIYMITTVSRITLDSVVKTVIIIAGIVAAAFAAASSTAVLVHLKKNKTRIYTEEIMTYENK